MHIINIKVWAKVCSADGCSSGKKAGMVNATAKFIMIVYVVRVAGLPPNFEVTTAAAVAVGHIKHSIKLSSVIFHSADSTNRQALMLPMKADVWIVSSQRCQRVKCSCDSFILQNVRNSMAKINIGCTIFIACFTASCVVLKKETEE